ncbi:hypothetical protein Rsub_00164 [Raphidocelis subcapitata]|uniref:Uncharacterized protein n=1 Tax=Raphidocelis subcapitata TaxID=307507 RepID=A0A2V0NPL4_9CHLO|nr:hypothetical protein Rsub_00164 [Raphidocelis subcapitata]|eukprot:GBF87453.1 hypothetical protein Rsub_00164 [Raphidocelis subcapitata]
MEADPLLLLDAFGDPVQLLQLSAADGGRRTAPPAAAGAGRKPPPPQRRAPPPSDLPAAAVLLALALAAVFACSVVAAAVAAASAWRAAPCGAPGSAGRGGHRLLPPAPADPAARPLAAATPSQPAPTAAVYTAAPSPPAQRRRRIALLHKVHGAVTLRALHAAMLAKQQVEEAGGWYGLLYSAHPDDAPPPVAAPGEVPATQAAIAVDALRRALGRGAVAVVGRSDVAAALGEQLLREQRRVFGEKEWAWATNDAVDAAWFLLHGEDVLPDWAQHVWLLELDVGWTGDLVGALESTVSCGASGGSRGGGSNGGGLRSGGTAVSGSSGSSAGGGGGGGGCGRDPDWVSFNTMRADEGWRWYAVRNFEPPAGVWRSYRHAARASRALLRALASELRAGRVASDEAMAPSVCAGAGWCAVDAGWQPGHAVIGRDRATGEALYRWELLIPPQRWERLAADDAEAARRCAAAASGAGADDAAAASGGAGGALQREDCVPGRLYHKLKW